MNVDPVEILYRKLAPLLAYVPVRLMVHADVVVVVVLVVVVVVVVVVGAAVEVVGVVVVLVVVVVVGAVDVVVEVEDDDVDEDEEVEELDDVVLEDVEVVLEIRAAELAGETALTRVVI